MQLLSILTCPHCRHAEQFTMPVDACQFFHLCSGCQTLLRANAGQCCVFCSFGSVPCPSMQTGEESASSGSCCRTEGSVEVRGR